jgi:arginine/lysine/ornithine decarboxylase
MLTPYPSRIPAVIPGELITRPILDHLRCGVQAGMVIPDAADASLDTLRVMIE